MILSLSTEEEKKLGSLKRPSELELVHRIEPAATISKFLRIDSHIGPLRHSNRDRHQRDRLDTRYRRHRFSSPEVAGRRQQVVAEGIHTVVVARGSLGVLHLVAGSILLAVAVGRIGAVEDLCCSNRWQT